MSHGCCGGPAGQAARRDFAALTAADGLSLASSPTFAITARLCTVLGDTPAEMLCSAAHVSPLSGMATMYLLMSAFHVAPWLNLIRERRPVGLRRNRGRSSREVRQQRAANGAPSKAETYDAPRRYGDVARVSKRLTRQCP